MVCQRKAIAVVMDWTDFDAGSRANPEKWNGFVAD